MQFERQSRHHRHRHHVCISEGIHVALAQPLTYANMSLFLWRQNPLGAIQKWRHRGEEEGGFAESVTNGDKGGRGLLVGGNVTTEKKIDSDILVSPL